MINWLTHFLITIIGNDEFKHGKWKLGRSVLMEIKLFSFQTIDWIGSKNNKQRITVWQWFVMISLQFNQF